LSSRLPFRLIVLADNTAAGTGVLAEHGLSILVESGQHRVLFDTGQGLVLRANAAALGVSLAPLDALVLSHGHYDHTGGVEYALEAGAPRAVYVHPAGFAHKYARRETLPLRAIGIPEGAERALWAVEERICWVHRPVEVVPGVWATGEIPRIHQEETDDGGPVFFLDELGRDSDPLLDDQALVLETPAGLVVVAGCAHAGIVNTLDHVAGFTGGERIHGVIGGLHLGRASERRLNATAEAFARRGVAFLAPGHCTGSRALAFLRTRFPGLVHDLGAGTQLEFR
jgi:7,8-dihydropterin-6-yl-methyl-4-(beta-D-ribofuranosyl)aminobenzene 5'-phosphate synthase